MHWLKWPPARLSIPLALLLAPSAAQAYIGPGVGAGTIAVVVGVIVSAGLAVFALLWYPIKRLMKKFKNPPGGGGSESEQKAGPTTER